MRVSLFGSHSSEIESLVREKGFVIDDNQPECIISCGGDGTLMRSEAKFPGIPKLVLKFSNICKKCAPYPNDVILEKVIKGEYQVEGLAKLEAIYEGQILKGANDIIVHNKNPRHGIRYSLKINNTILNKEIIGDGVVISTPFGSTGYYKSITGSFFEIGIGLAFNNSTEQVDHMVIKENSEIEIKISRGPAEVFADNEPKSFILKDDEIVTIRKSLDQAYIITPW